MVFLQVSLFLSLFILIIGGSHYFLYFSIVRFFSISANQKNALILALSLLAVSFILTSLFAHWKEGPITRACYFLSGFWLGFLTNLILASISIWIIILITNFLGLNIGKIILATSFFTIAFLISLYGTWNAYHPKIKTVTISIPKLPTDWQGKKIVQLSDVHLGLLYRKNFLKNIVAQVNSVNAEMVLITGDFFDGMDGSLDALVEPMNDLAAPQGIFFVNGNHETYLGTEKTFSALAKTKVQILKDQVIDVSGLKLIGIGYPERDLKKDIVAILQKLKPDFLGKPNILLYHSPTNIKQFSENGINLQLSGHTHLGQLFPFNFITKFIYHGYDYGLHQIGDYTLYTTNGVGTWGPMMRTNSAPEIVEITLQEKK